MYSINKNNKQREREAEAQKLIQQKLQDISHFQGEPPEDEQLLNILKKRSKLA